MKKVIILIVLSVVCLLTSCSSYDAERDARIAELTKVEFDGEIMSTSLDGFRIQMTARMAKQVAEERGYIIDGRYSDVTFDDVTDTGDVDERYIIYLHRYIDIPTSTSAEQSVQLGFRYGRIYSINHEYHRYPREHCEEQLKSFLAKFPLLAIINESDTFRSYSYKANELATVSATFKDWQTHDGWCSVSRSIWDSNYAQIRWNEDFYERLETINRRYR